MLSFSISPRQKITLSAAVTGIVTLVLIAFITYPSVLEIKSLNTTIDAQRVELEAQYLRGLTLKQTLKTYQDVKQNIEVLNHVYLTPGKELDFITALEHVADTTHVSQQIKLNTPSAAQNQPDLPIQLTLAGNLANVIQYLSTVEALDYYVNVDTLRLGLPNLSGTPRGSVGQLGALLTATTFLKP